MSRWFRMYDEVLDDPKVQRLNPVLFRTWVNILCAAARNEGVIPPLDVLSFMLRLDERILGEQMDELIASGLIDETDDGVTPHNWSGRQYQSDTSNDRVKRYRNKQRNVTPTVTVTPPDTETETDIEPNGSSAAAPETLDPRKLLFGDGLKILSKLTDRKPEALRSTLGRWMKLTGDDAGAVLSEIEKCRGSPVADPIAWIEAQLKPKETPNDKRRRVTSAEQAAASMGRVLASIDRQHQRNADAAFWGERDESPGDGAETISGRLEAPALYGT